MMKYLMVLLSLFSGSVLGMGRVNELCGIDSVKTIEIINLPSYVTTLVPLSKEGLNEKESRQRRNPYSYCLRCP